MLFKKIETNILDVMLIYGCAAFITYVVGNVAYTIGKNDGKNEAKNKIADISHEDSDNLKD